jgi:hypothetical protein
MEEMILQISLVLQDYVDPTSGFIGLCNGLWDVDPWVYPCLGIFVRNCKSINR